MRFTGSFTGSQSTLRTPLGVCQKWKKRFEKHDELQQLVLSKVREMIPEQLLWHFDNCIERKGAHQIFGIRPWFRYLEISIPKEVPEYDLQGKPFPLQARREFAREWKTLANIYKRLRPRFESLSQYYDQEHRKIFPRYRIPSAAELHEVKKSAFRAADHRTSMALAARQRQANARVLMTLGPIKSSRLRERVLPKLVKFRDLIKRLDDYMLLGGVNLQSERDLEDYKKNCDRLQNQANNFAQTLELSKEDLKSIKPWLELVLDEHAKEFALFHLKQSASLEAESRNVLKESAFVKQAIITAVKKDDLEFFRQVGYVLLKGQNEKSFRNLNALESFLTVNWVSFSDEQNPLADFTFCTLVGGIRDPEVPELYNLSIEALHYICREKKGWKALSSEALEKVRQRLGLVTFRNGRLGRVRKLSRVI